MADTKISALTAATDVVSAEFAGQQGGATKRFGIALFNAIYQPVLATLTSWGAITRASGFDTFVATPTSANLAALVTNETGTGLVVFGTDPALLGTPTAPTAAALTNTTQIATTAFVTSAVSAVTPNYGTGNAALSVGGVGTYALLVQSSPAIRSPGYSTSGANLAYTNASGSSGTSPSGTWMLMGAITSPTGTSNQTSNWLRIS